MKVVDQQLLNAFKLPGICDYCGKKVRSRDPHHICSRGHGGGNRLDISLNILSLCSTFAGGDNCHQRFHDGHISRDKMFEIAAIKKDIPVELLKGLLNWFERAPKEPIERICVTGGRDYTDAKTINRVLEELYVVHGFSVLIHGAARGADTLADEWANIFCVERIPFKADWQGDGKIAGPVRNSRMLVEGRPQLVVAFNGGAGTKDCVNKAVRRGIDVLDVAI